MLTSFVLAGCAILCDYQPSDTPEATQAAETQEQDLATTIRKLVRDLDAPEKSKRDEAEQALLGLGSAAVDLLPETNERTPAEVALRIGRVRSQLERSRAEDSVKATLVTMTDDELSLDDALQALEKQTGNKLVDYRGQFGQEVSDQKIKLQCAGIPFWEAVDQILDQSGLTTYPYPDPDQSPNALALVGRSQTQVQRHGNASYAGSFRIEATEFDAHRDLRDPSNQTLQLLLEATWEPRLNPILIMQPADGIQASDESGATLQPSSDGNEMEIPVNPGAKTVEMPFHFALPDRKIQRIASLKGKFLALMPGRVETFKFDKLDKAKKVERKKAGVTVVLDEVFKNQDVWEVRIRILFDKSSAALESHRGWILNNEAYLEDKNKEVIPYGSLNTTRQTETEVGIAYLFDLPNGPKGLTFIYKTPSAIINVPVDYELKDLVLP